MPAPSRRTLVGTGGAVALAAPLLGAGTAAGPAIRGTRHGIASAVVVDGPHHLVDFGQGMPRQAVTMDYYRGQDFTEEFLHHLEASHTSPEGIGRIAAEAGVKKVVVSQLTAKPTSGPPGPLTATRLNATRPCSQPRSLIGWLWKS